MVEKSNKNQNSKIFHSRKELTPHLDQANRVINVAIIGEYSPWIKQFFLQHPDKIDLVKQSALLADDRDLFVDDIKDADKLEQIELMAILRQQSELDMICIACQELSGITDSLCTIRQMSELAQSCLKIAYQHAYAHLTARYGQPMDQQGLTADFVILGLGKLGGTELNFYSDIDLIFSYSAQGETSGAKQIDNQQFFIKLGQQIIKILNDVTEDGRVFNVDMRLRPYGDGGALVSSFSSMENYYQHHGREWERYAWIKARALAVNISSANLLIKRLKPFVYRKYLDYRVYRSILDMKNMINQEIKAQGMENNIKLGRGGIREVEFFVQCHQLLQAGRYPPLMTTSLEEALNQLRQIKLISNERAKTLYSDYLFLRSIENRIQMYQLEQSHTLPNDDERLKLLSKSMGYDQLDVFKADLKHTRDRIHALFNSLGDQEDQPTEKDDQLLSYKNIWQSYTRQITSQEQVSQFNDLINEEQQRLIKDYAQSISVASLGSRGREILDTLIPKLIKASLKMELSSVALGRCLNVLQAIGKRSAYLELLNENREIRENFVDFCGISDWVSQWLSKYPIVLDRLIKASSDDEVFDQLAQSHLLETKIAAHPDPEMKIELLRQHHHSWVLQNVMAEIKGQLSINQVRENLTQIAQTMISQALKMSGETMQNKISMDQIEQGFMVIAYGKMGSRELGYDSDLDMVFLYHDADVDEDPEVRYERNRQFMRLTRKLTHVLSVQTMSGNLYQIDTRLRPSGNKGLLLSSIGQYEKYQKEEAWLWEHQALIKARAIVGSEENINQFERIRSEILSQKRDTNELIDGVLTMREKMREQLGSDSLKMQHGGMVDIEFLCQFFVLKHAYECPSLLEHRSVEAILTCVIALKLYPKEKIEQLILCYQVLLAQENYKKLTGQLKYSDKDISSHLKTAQQHCQDMMTKEN